MAVGQILSIFNECVKSTTTLKFGGDLLYLEQLTWLMIDCILMYLKRTIFRAIKIMEFIVNDLQDVFLLNKTKMAANKLFSETQLKKRLRTKLPLNQNLNVVFCFCIFFLLFFFSCVSVIMKLKYWLHWSHQK